MTDKFKILLARCKCEVFLSINEHRNYHVKAEAYLNEKAALFEASCAKPEVLAKMIETDTVIELQFYPETPVGFHRVWHHDLDAALDEALACLEGPSR